MLNKHYQTGREGKVIGAWSFGDRDTGQCLHPTERRTANERPKQLGQTLRHNHEHINQWP